ncbi:MFS transporter [soil metagenome]
MTSAKIAPGTQAYRLLLIAMLLAGLATFALLYSVQPLLPLFSHDYRVNAEEASLVVSLATGPMAIALLAAGALSDRFGRRPLMIASLFSAAILTLLSAMLPGWHMLLAMRLFTGVALAGIPAVAMAFIAEEVEDKAVGHAMGLYIAGSAIGGMSGRLVVSLITQYTGWRVAMAITGVLALGIAIVFYRCIPASRHFVPRRQSLSGFLAGLQRLMADRAMPWLYAVSFLLMGAFISIYNYAGFRLLAPPYGLSQAAIGAIFLLYIIGSFSSAWIGGVAGRIGPRKTLWAPIALFLVGIGLTAATPLPIVIFGIAVVTAGFFGAHSIASAWVGRRARADRAQASALYLFFYYMGSSLLGSAGGFAWTHALWPGVVLFAGALIVAALAISLRLSSVLPLAPDAKPVDTAIPVA